MDFTKPIEHIELTQYSPEALLRLQHACLQFLHTQQLTEAQEITVHTNYDILQRHAKAAERHRVQYFLETYSTYDTDALRQRIDIVIANLNVLEHPQSAAHGHNDEYVILRQELQAIRGILAYRISQQRNNAA